MTNVIFGAELDSSGVKKGTAEIVTALQELKDTNAELIEQNVEMKKVMGEVEAATAKAKEKTVGLVATNKDLSKEVALVAADMKKVSAEIDRTEKAMSKANTSTVKGEKEFKQLSVELKKLNADYDRGNVVIDTMTKKINENTAVIVKNQAATAKTSDLIKKSTAEIKENEATIAANNKTIASTEKAMENAAQSTGKFAGGLSKAYGGIRTIANILPGVGIGTVFLGGYEAIITLAEGLDLFNTKLSQTQKNTEALKTVQLNAADSYGKEKAELDLLVTSIQAEGTSRKEKFALLDELQKKYPGYFDNIKTETDLTDKLTKAYENASQGILLKAYANAAQDLIGANVGKRLKAEIEFRDKEKQIGLERVQELQREINLRGSAENGAVLQLKKLYDDAQKARTKAFGDEISDLDNQNKFLLDKIMGYNKDIVTLGGKNPLLPTKTAKGPKGPENVFAEQLAELRARLAASAASEFQSKPLIETKFREQLNKEFANIDKLLKEKKLTGPQADILKGLLKQINDIDLAKSLTEFRKKQQDAIDKVNDEIAGAIISDSTKRVANIRDEFEREKQGIEAGYEATISGIKKQFATVRKGIEEEVSKGFISKAEGQKKINLFAFIFGDLESQAEIDKTNKQLDLAFKVFEDTIKEKQRALQNILVQNDERTALISTDLVDKFLNGKISYQKYQEGLTQLAKDAARIRINVTINELKQELAAVTATLANTTDGPIKKKLEDQQLQIRKQIADLTAQQDNAEGKDSNDASSKKIKTLVSYAQAINGVLSSVVSFWNQVNAVESAALDRSIALQQRRVDNAQEIADRGNAEYLEMEQKRLDELQRKKEENARKQVAINNALTLSNATVAAVSAIAEAVSSGNPLLAIAALAAVISAIGAAFAFADSLQPQSASFYEGVESVSGTGAPRGKDTVKANLNIGERVITTDTNAAYWDTLTAIHNRNIPANVLNEFVNSYPSVNIPSVDFDTLSEATNNKLGSDSYEVARKLEGTNQRLDDLLTVMSGLKVEANVDENGLGVALTTHIRNMNIKRRM